MVAGAASAVAMWLFDAALQRAAGDGSNRMLVLLGGAAVFVVLPTLVFVIGRDYLAQWRSGASGAAYRQETRAALRRGLAWLIGGAVAWLLLSSLKDFQAA
jgi:hypothetical protein